MAVAVVDDRQDILAPSPRERTGLKFSVVGPDAITQLLPEWAVLAARSAGDNLFFRSEFAVPAMRSLGDRVSIATVALRDGRLAALAPFTGARLGRFAPAKRLWAHAYAPLGLPLIDRDAIAPAVGALVAGLAGRGSLIVPDLPLDGPVAAALRAAATRANRPVDVLDRHVRAVLDRTAAGPAGVRAALPAKRRKEFSRQMRRLAERGRVTFETRIEPADVRSRFEVFMALEAAGWKGKRGTALISHKASADFAREAVRALADAGAARIDSVDVDREPIAMVVSFAAGATAFTWKIAYDETYARYSPGVQLMLEVAAGIFSDPTIARIDSCAAAHHPMIDHLWGGRMAIGTLVIGPPGGGILYRAGVLSARAELAAKAMVKRVRS